jgi:hypothetical protein
MWHGTQVVDSQLDPDSTMASEPTLSTLAMLAAEADATSAPSFSTLEDPSAPSTSRGKTKEQVRRYYLKALHKVIDQSDIIILVLDARDPEGCRSRLVEEEVRRRESEGKKLVFVLNKIGAFLDNFLLDLLPWLTLLIQTSFPKPTHKHGLNTYGTPPQLSLSSPLRNTRGITSPRVPHPLS